MYKLILCNNYQRKYTANSPLNLSEQQPRAVLVDLESGIIDAIRGGPQGKLFREGL